MNVGEPGISNKAFRSMAALILVMIACSFPVLAQESVLDKRITVRMNNVKRQAVLRYLTRETGYIFTYDTRLIKPLDIVSINESEETLKTILDKIFPDENFGYSVLENHIIIFRNIDQSTPMIREGGKVPVYMITGTIVESVTGKPLPFATIGIFNKGIGTISNNEGIFNLKVPENSLADSMRISYLGFRDRTIPVNQAINNNYIIELERSFVPIPEIIIRTRKPLDLIEGIHRNIGKNYGSSPTIMRAFYRESVSKKNKIQLYSEAVINIYKSSYTRSFQTDQLSVFKSRKIENIDNSDTLILKLQAGLDACLALDGLKNKFDFIKQANYEEYNYRMTDIVNIGDEAAYLIEFSQKENITDNALFKGSIYVNTDNYGVHSAEFEINPDYIDLMSDSFIRESSRHYSVRLQKVKYKVDYRYVNNRFYLNHVRGDMEFHARKKRKLFGSSYNILFEMAVTGIDSTRVHRFTRDEIAPRQSIFSETITQYDADFWGTDNFMQPEIDIQEALILLNARMGKYIKEE